MSDYPERISISPVHRQKRDDDFYLVDRKALPGKGVEYVRADIMTDFETRPVGTGKRIEELEAALATARRDALEDAANKISGMLYLLSIGTPGEGPFTRQDRTRDEVIDQAAAAIRALIDKEPT